MRDEIREQPQALARTLDSEWATIEALRQRFQTERPPFIVLAARGTSDNAATFGRYLLEITTGIPVSLAAPSVYTLYDGRVHLKNALLVAVSQSGESTDVNTVLSCAKSSGALTIGITNEPESTMARVAEYPVLVRANKEKSVAATKTYTGQLLSFYLLAYALGAPIKREQLERLPELVQTALDMESEINARAERYRFMEHAVVIARGLNYANAFEFALKLMETSYVIAERFSSADLLHGPIAMVEQSFPTFLFAPTGVTEKPVTEMLTKLQDLRAETLVIGDQSSHIPDGVRALRLPISLAHQGPLPADVFTPIPYVVPAQLFAACLAEVKGLNPDQPRTLSKVTRTL